MKVGVLLNTVEQSPCAREESLGMNDNALELS